MIYTEIKRITFFLILIVFISKFKMIEVLSWFGLLTISDVENNKYYKVYRYVVYFGSLVVAFPTVSFEYIFFEYIMFI